METLISILAIIALAELFNIIRNKVTKIKKPKTDYKPPFRVGRKQRRAILDSRGYEVTVLPKGQEEFAEYITKLLNKNG